MSPDVFVTYLPDRSRTSLHHNHGTYTPMVSDIVYEEDPWQQ